MPHINNKGYWEETPEFRSEMQRDDYWKREAERWWNGYSFGQYGFLSGLHYFHLTMGNLISGKSGRIVPEWRDADGAFFDAYLECLAENKNMYEIKWRGFGFSSNCMAIVVYNSIMYECEQIITSIDNSRVLRMRNKIFIPYLQGLQKEEIIPVEKFSNDINAIRVSSDSGVTISPVYFQETTSDKTAVQKLESYRARLIVLDELFLHNYSSEVLLSAEGSTTEQGEKFGTIIAGGNCNNMNPESAGKITEMCEHAESRGFKVHVTPGCMGRRGFMKPDPKVPSRNVSEIMKATEYIKNELEKRKKEGDWDAYYNYKKENFLSLSDLMTSTSGAGISEDMQGKIINGRMKAEVLNIQPCRLIWNPDGVFMDYDPKGKFWIAEEPQKGHVYIAGCDPILGTGQGERGSDFVCAIKDITTGRYVAYYAERTTDKNEMYARWKMLLTYYKSNSFPNGACCMFERNAMATIDAIAGERGERYLLAADPSSKDGSVKGYHKPPNTKIDEKLNTLIENHINKYDVPFIRFYQEFDKIHDSKANLDLMDAIKSCEYYYSFFTRIGDEKDKDIIRKKIITVDQQGNTQTKWIKIGYNDRIS